MGTVSYLIAQAGEEAGVEIRMNTPVARVMPGEGVRLESGELLQSVAGQEVAPQLTAALYRETGGNPLFLGELLRHLIETDDAFLEVRSGDFDLGAQRQEVTPAKVPTSEKVERMGRIGAANALSCTL